MAFNYLESLIKRKIANRTPIDKKISDYLVVADDGVLTMTITQLAHASGVSETSIYKYVKKLGFTGYGDFKINLASNAARRQNAEQGITVLTDIKPDDQPIDIAQKVVQYNVALLHDFSDFIDADKLNKTLGLMYDAHSLTFIGQSGSSAIAFDSYHKFLRSKYPCNYIFDYHIQLSYATKLGPDDVVFLFSHSGVTKETIAVGEQLHKSGAKIITLTGSPASPLIQLSDVSFVLFTEEVAAKAESMSSKILYTTLTDILFLNLMFHDEKANQAATQKIRNALSITRAGINTDK